MDDVDRSADCETISMEGKADGGCWEFCVQCWVDPEDAKNRNLNQQKQEMNGRLSRFQDSPERDDVKQRARKAGPHVSGQVPVNMVRARQDSLRRKCCRDLPRGKVQRPESWKLVAYLPKTIHFQRLVLDILRRSTLRTTTSLARKPQTITPPHPKPCLSLPKIQGLLTAH